MSRTRDLPLALGSPPGAVGRLRPLVWLAAAWALASLVYGSHLYLFHTLRGAETRLAFQMREAALHLGIWALLTPLVLLLARRRPILGPTPLRGLVFHVAVGVLVAAVQIGAHGVADLVLLHGGRTDPVALLERVVRLFTRTFYANVFLYFALVLGVNALENAQRRRAQTAELRRDLVQSQLDALRLQLRPHFLFNALNSLASLIPRDPARAEQMVLRLSDLLRRVLDPASADRIPLERELDLARSYLAVEEVRFSDRLSVEIEVEPELERALVPGLVLQPLLENAIRHGISARPGPGTVEVVARRRGDRLLLVVRDDGVGLAGEDATEGIGLGNVRTRLETLSPGSRLDLLDRPGGGTEATVEIPLELAPEGSDGGEP